jgi:hypothetical protein
VYLCAAVIMRPRPLPLVCLSLLLLALAWGLSGSRSPLPAGDEATSVMMAESLWHDRDLAWRQADLERAEQLWEGGPAGLTLFTDDGGKTLRYGRPLAYPLAALPFYAAFGVRGISLFAMALFLAMALAALWLLADGAGAPLFVGGFFFASAALACAFRREPDVLLMACVFFPLLAWRRLDGGKRDSPRLAGAGLLLGAATTASPLLGLLGLPVVIDLASRRRWRSVAALLLSATLAVGVLALIQRAGTGEWSAFGGLQRRTFDAEFPLESPRDLWQGYRAEEAPSGIAAGLRLLPRNLGYLLAGRFTGLLPYFPFALFALILFLAGRQDRARRLLAATLLLYAVLVLILHPHDFAGAPGFPGSRYLAWIYPAFLFLPESLRARRSLVFPCLAAGFWTAAALLQPALPGTSRLFQRLPLELTLIAGDHLPGFSAQTWGEAVWVVPRESFFAEERHPHGVWVRGGTRSEVIVVSPKPLSRLAFTAYSLSGANVLTLDGGAGRLTVRFDTAGKRAGTPIDLPLAPVARDLGFFPAGRETLYRLALDTTAGLVPARIDPKSHDPRYLGVFLDLTGEGP